MLKMGKEAVMKYNTALFTQQLSSLININASVWFISLFSVLLRLTVFLWNAAVLSLICAGHVSPLL